MKLIRGLLAVTVALLVVTAGKGGDQKSDQDAIVKSFKQYAGDFVRDWNVKHSVPVVSWFQFHPPESPKLWDKTYFVTVKDYDVDVKVTDSLINPYVGVLKFTQIWASSTVYTTKEEAEKSKDCGGIKSVSDHVKPCSEDPKAQGTSEVFDCIPKDEGRWECKGGRLIKSDPDGHEY